mmetsp:Transcript_19943/g.33615  ORF Transcript_19943/g.33615 Transcript_19943/m.33615 type:complete len:178 (+) Transcript_19943:70-603(+)
MGNDSSKNEVMDSNNEDKGTQNSREFVQRTESNNNVFDFDSSVNFDSTLSTSQNSTSDIAKKEKTEIRNFSSDMNFQDVEESNRHHHGHGHDQKKENQVPIKENARAEAKPTSPSSSKSPQFKHLDSQDSCDDDALENSTNSITNLRTFTSPGNSNVKSINHKRMNSDMNIQDLDEF